MHLTKSSYISGVHCHKRLWQETYAPERAAPMGVAQRRVVKQGTDLGVLARQRHPGGLLIQGHGAPAMHATRDALADGAPILFEAAFVHDDVLVRCDILTQDVDGGWALIEVKGSTSVKPEHIQDLAIQFHVLAGAGLPVTSTHLMHVNRSDCVFPELDNLFTTVDVTGQVLAAADDVPQRLLHLRAILAGAEPDFAVGAHCDTPYLCPFHGHCWRDVPATSILFVPRLRDSVIQSLMQQNILHVHQLPAGLSLTEQQRRYVHCVTEGEPFVDRPGIRQRMCALQFPLHFFDFETDAPAMPRFAGMRPYDKLPFQYSCHVLHEDGRLEHHDYIHTSPADPRPALVDALARDILPTGSVVAYNAQFERSVLQDLAQALPAAAPMLRGIVERLWDQLDIFRHHYTMAEFRGSNSIKHVLPALIPELTYQDLAIQKGDDAQAIWAEMVQCTDEERRAQLVADLRAYCQRDTLAMVALHHHLARLCLEPGEPD